MNCLYCLKSEDLDRSHSLVENYPRKKTKIKQREETSLILILYRLNPQLEFFMIKQKQSGLLSGLWSFFEIDLPDDLNERKRKDFIIEQIQRMTTVNINNIKLAGQVFIKDHQFIIFFFSSVVIYFLILINNILYIILIMIKMKSPYPHPKSNGLAKINCKHQLYQQR